MNVLVVGATGGTGQAVVRELAARGHAVTAFARRPDTLPAIGGLVRATAGDVMSGSEVSDAVRGHDAVIVTLGIRENAVRVRLLGSAATPINVRSMGTARVIEAMHRHAVTRLIVQTSFGVGETRAKLPLKWRLIFALLLGPQIADTERQEMLVRGSRLAWTLVQPVSLTDADDQRPPFTSPTGEVRSMSVSRQVVARCLADAVEGPQYGRRVLSVS
jgi:uncharacterized protein YbjT (DUF2867 family)